MNIAYIIPGTGGSFYCENCIRDCAMIAGLRANGHRVTAIPLYLPLMHEENVPLGDAPIFFGAVRIYLEEHIRALQILPDILLRQLDRGAMLRYAASKAGATRAAGHENMTIHMLEGTEGPFSREFERMVRWVEKEVAPEAVFISNGFLLGVAQAFKTLSTVKVAAFLQDEHTWIDVSVPQKQNELWEKDPQQMKVIQFRKNSGKAAALAAGFKEAQGKLIVTMDADLQDDPAEIKNLISKINEGNDLVSGWKQKRHDPVNKTLPSKIFNSVVRKMSGIKIHDFNCGLKIYKREVADNLTVYGDMHRFLPVLAHWEGFRIAEIPVQHHARKFGVTKYGLSRLITGFLDFLTIIFLHRHAKSPLHFFGTIGLAIGSFGFLINLYILILWIIHGNIQHHQPLMTLGVLLMIISFQFICTGLVSELIVKMYINDEKKFSIKHSIGCQIIKKSE